MVEVADLVSKLVNAGVNKKEAKKEVSILLEEFGMGNLHKIKKMVDKRVKTRIPLQYLLGKAYFMDFEVTVTPKVLIPRPETEVLVEETVKRLPTECRGVPWHALDIGTGSGIVAIALVKLIPDIKIIAIDIEEEIIDLARENAKMNSVKKRIDFKVCDLFLKEADELFETNKFNLVISNPPYLVNNTRQPEIAHEPNVALYGSKENKRGLVYYERIFELCSGIARNAPTLLALEIDPPLVNDLKDLLKNKRLNNFEIVKDYAKLDRCLFVYL